MSDFDQLIKEKINSKEYAYSAKNWQSFTQKAGWRRKILPDRWAWAAIASAVLAVAGLATFWLLSRTPRTAHDQWDANKPQPVTVADTLKNVTEAENVSYTETETSNHTTTATTTIPKRPVTAVPEPDTPTDTIVTKPVPAQKNTRTERITRIFVIDPDTIPSNDF